MGGGSFEPRKPPREELETEEAGEEEEDIPSGSAGAGHGLGIAFMVAPVVDCPAKFAHVYDVSLSLRSASNQSWCCWGEESFPAVGASTPGSPSVTHTTPICSTAAAL